ncbi:MAG: alpha/beta family hydrolase [Hyphomicrobium sp.]
MSHPARSDLKSTGRERTSSRLILAHGAGAGMSSPFMEAISGLITERGIQVTRFEFDYIAARRDGGRRRPPPRAETLTGEYLRFLETVAAERRPNETLLIGGKSLGGRVASLIADAAFDAGLISGLACLGYPFHPPGKPDQLRTAHLVDLRCPALIVQGERDPFGNRNEVALLNLPNGIILHWAGDGDHDLGPRGASGFTRKGNLAAAADAVAAFAAGLPPPR